VVAPAFFCNEEVSVLLGASGSGYSTIVEMRMVTITPDPADRATK
jgi:ABC-type proline/glycine betaine transport system ATPase subunit